MRIVLLLHMRFGVVFLVVVLGGQRMVGGDRGFTIEQVVGCREVCVIRRFRVVA